jgi:hypothetical protein
MDTITKENTIKNTMIRVESNSDLINLIINELTEEEKPINSTIKINKVIDIYFDHFTSIFFKSISGFVLRIIQMLITIFVVCGIFLPKRYLGYYICVIISLLFAMEVLDGKTPISKIIEKIEDKYVDLIPMDENPRRNMLIMLLIISIVSYVFPQINLFELVKSGINSV